MPDHEDDNTHTTEIVVEGMCHVSQLNTSVETLGMWILDVAADRNLNPTTGVVLYLYDDDEMALPVPRGWVAYRLSVGTVERFDAEV